MANKSLCCCCKLITSMDNISIDNTLPKIFGTLHFFRPPRNFREPPGIFGTPQKFSDPQKFSGPSRKFSGPSRKFSGPPKLAGLARNLPFTEIFGTIKRNFRDLPLNHQHINFRDPTHLQHSATMHAVPPSIHPASNDWVNDGLINAATINIAEYATKTKQLIANDSSNTVLTNPKENSREAKRLSVRMANDIATLLGVTTHYYTIKDSQHLHNLPNYGLDVCLDTFSSDPDHYHHPMRSCLDRLFDAFTERQEIWGPDTVGNNLDSEHWSSLILAKIHSQQ